MLVAARLRIAGTRVALASRTPFGIFGRIAGKPHAFPPGTWALRHLVKPDARAVPVDRATKFADHDL